MRTLLKNLFINNWPRKCLSVILAIIIWFVVNKSLTTNKTISNVPVKIENIPPGKTVEGIQSNGFLNRRVNLTLSGNKGVLDDLNANDLQIVFDASGQEGEWIATISRKNLRANNSDINISQGISRVSQQNFIIKLTKLVSEKIPIIITQPIGESPSGYQFVDIWPYQLNITVSGPKDIVKKLKSRGLNLTFNLNDITKTKLDPNNVVENRSGIKMITETLYAKGVSALFLDVIKDMLEIAVIVNPNDDGKLEWSTQFINAKALEDRYLRFIKSDATDDEFRDLQPYLRDNYLRNRFRNYMNRFQLYKSENEAFEIVPRLQGNSITVTEIKQDES